MSFAKSMRDILLRSLSAKNKEEEITLTGKNNKMKDKRKAKTSQNLNEAASVLGQDISVTKHRLDNGIPSFKDIMAPPSFDRSSPDHICVGQKYVRSFLIVGFPKMIAVGWANNLYNYEGDLDMAIHVNPTDERTAMDELTSKITQFEAQLQTELEKGSNRNITRLRAQIDDLYQERMKAEQNYISLFSIQMPVNLYADSLEQLDKETQLLENSLKGHKIKLMPMYLRQDLGYKSGLPFGKSWLPRNYRNFNSEALTACYPFYNSEISHRSGVFLGVNNQTQTPIYIDFYDRRILNNGNTTVFGPEFEPLAEVLYELGLEPFVISESCGTQSDDARTMKMIYERVCASHGS